MYNIKKKVSFKELIYAKICFICCSAFNANLTRLAEGTGEYGGSVVECHSFKSGFKPH